MGIKRAGRDFVFFFLLLLLLSPFLFNPIWAQTSVGPILTLCSIVCAPISRIKKLAFLAMSINFQIFMRCFAQHHLFRVFVNNNKSDTSISRIVYEGRAKGVSCFSRRNKKVCAVWTAVARVHSILLRDDSDSFGGPSLRNIFRCSHTKTISGQTVCIMRKGKVKKRHGGFYQNFHAGA